MNRPPLQLRLRPVAAVRLLAPAELDQLFRGHSINRRVGYAKASDNVCV